MTQQLSAWASMLEGSVWQAGEEANGWKRGRNDRVGRKREDKMNNW